MEHQSKRTHTRLLTRKIRIIVRDIETNQEYGEDIKEENPPEYVSDDTGQVLGGVFGLAGCYGDGFCAAVGKRGGYEDGGEAANAIHEGRVADIPVVCAEVMVGGVATAVHDDSEDDEDLDVG